jgi:hypothetical protein
MTYTEAVDYYGSAAEMARALGGLARSTVSEWRDGIPIGRQYQIELDTKGALRAERTAEPQKEAA